MKKGCPVEAFLKIIGQRWSSYILWVLESNGQMRFGELKRLVPNISQKVLTSKLRDLEKATLVSRTYEPTIPPTVTYELTNRGKELKYLLYVIGDTAYKWREDNII
jgi:DNA-binding HxlR family transcriptional regulator